MINLLPTNDKREILAGRTNRILLRYVVLFLIISGCILVVFAMMYVFLFAQRGRAEQQIKDNDAKVARLSTEKQEVEEFTKNLTTIKQILGKRVNYTSGLVRLAQLVPSGVTIQSLSLSADTIASPQTLVVRSVNEEQAILFKDALNNADTYFSNAKFETITRDQVVTDTPNPYPYYVSMSVQFKKELFDEK